MIYIHPKPYVQ